MEKLIKKALAIEEREERTFKSLIFILYEDITRLKNEGYSYKKIHTRLNDAKVLINYNTFIYNLKKIQNESKIKKNKETNQVPQNIIPAKNNESFFDKMERESRLKKIKDRGNDNDTSSD